MVFKNKSLSIFWNIPKGSPEIYTIAFLLYPAFNPNLKGLYTSLLLISVLLVNFILKTAVFKQLYKLSGRERLPILGLGRRPGGNPRSCSSFFGMEPKGHSATYGMPSGHSQLTWTITTLVILQLFNEEHERNLQLEENDLALSKANYKIKKFAYQNKYLVAGFMIAFSLLISFSRVAIEKCHTPQQVIVGAFVGIGLGYLTNYIINEYI